MSNETKKNPIALIAAEVPPRPKGSVYPEPFAARIVGREKRTLGDPFGLKNFGVNLVRLAPGGQSALLHRHVKQDEFIYVIEGSPTLVTDQGDVGLKPGACAGFPAGGIAHHVVNRSDKDAVYLEIGDRLPGDGANYPNDDLVATKDPAGPWRFTHKDGTPY
ncbi:MAG: cupin domain-containing protein [Alphaproteobacteria bacterium]|nr:cupin domain-containing protein [Alphaproteobacteria bacterium]